MTFESILTEGITVLTIIGALALFVSVVVQLTKEFIPKKIPTKLYVLGVSLVSSLIGVPSFLLYKGIPPSFFTFVGSIALGFFSAYVSTYGWDSLKELKDRFIKQ